jgi:Lsr2
VATRRVVTRVDHPDSSTGAHTVPFGLDGQAYAIDLTDVHAQQFREVLAPCVSTGRRLTSATARTSGSTSTPEPTGRDGANDSPAGRRVRSGGRQR